ncbi:amidase [Nocardioides sp. GY 10127]|uniref:amidase n=1 Tax=Nocardioides sp. GY 10127 TaxID=2569762 RepID=UPI0010A7948F|nr:amidase [Nocardioides sp. GY 10127]TIC85524.1 amidase [Nocardioides sp. GY 10127]
MTLAPSDAARRRPHVRPRPDTVVGPHDGPAGWPAAKVADAVRRGLVSAESVLEAHLARIDVHDAVLHSFVLVDAARARQDARAVDAAVAEGHDPGPLAGVPFAVKDNIDVAGEVTACGSLAHGGRRAATDAEVVARLRAAGAVLVGRTTMDELAMGASTITAATGPAGNPWDPERSPGGSSGGCASAVAAGLVSFAVGTDTGGSVREPASQCGVLGLAPTPGLVSTQGVVPYARGFDRVGPLAREAETAALVLSVLATRPEHGVTPDLAEARDGRVLRGLRLGVVRELSELPNTAGVRERVGAVLARAEAGGAELVPVSVPQAREALEAYLLVTSVLVAPVVAPWVATGRAGAHVVRRHRDGRELAAGSPALDRARLVRRRLRTALDKALDPCRLGVDLLVSPTMPTTAPLLSALRTPSGLEGITDPALAPYTDCWTVVANMAGLPALSLPAGPSHEDGLPVGAMLTGRRGEDALLLAAAAALALPAEES